MKRIIGKFFGAFLIIILAMSSLILWFTFKSIHENYLDFIGNQLLNLDYSMRNQVTPLLLESKYKELDSVVKISGRDINTRITIIDTTGTVLADSQSDPKLMENHADRPEIIEARTKGLGKSERYSHTVKDNMLYLGIPITYGGKIIGYSRVSLYLHDINSWIAGLRNNILQISLIIIGFALLIAFLFARSISNPIRKLVFASRKVAEGDFEAKVYVSNKDEIRELADSFNIMTNRIKSLFDAAEAQREELNSIITSLRDGFAVLDQKGKIILHNDFFKTIAQTESAENKNYWEVIRSGAFNEFLESTIKRKKGFAAEIGMGGKYYLCSSTWLGSKNEIVLIMSDITQLKQLESIKKDFVVNVSHELRTPLTAIKGFIETLQDEAEDKQQRYLGIIERHTDRLINIVNDLLMLSKLEDAGQKLEVTDTDLGELTRTVLRMFEPKVAAKNLYLKFEIESDFPKIKADQYKIEHMLINLIDNAIKYTDEGGVTIRISKSADFARVEIEDTGIGIPREKAERVFERFFTVDNSRSRKVGGTGLGLSIVKHIVQSHGGEIKIEYPEKGTRFSVMLPLEGNLPD